MIRNPDENLILGIIVTVSFLLAAYMIGGLISRYISGWNLIERSFRAKGRSLLHNFGWQFFSAGRQTIWIDTNPQKRNAGFMKVGVTGTGIYLGFHFPYFPAMRAVNLPWEEIDIQKEATSSTDYEIIVKKFLKFRIILSSELAKRLLSYKP